MPLSVHILISAMYTILESKNLVLFSAGYKKVRETGRYYETCERTQGSRGKNADRLGRRPLERDGRLTEPVWSGLN